MHNISSMLTVNKISIKSHHYVETNDITFTFFKKTKTNFRLPVTGPILKKRRVLKTKTYN